MAKRSGTAHVMVVIEVKTTAAVDAISKMYPDARTSGTVTHFQYTDIWTPTDDLVVIASWDHHAMNEGNTEHDARQAIKRAMGAKAFDVLRIFSTWTADPVQAVAAAPEKKSEDMF